jgi:hypothetical protein
MGAGRNSKHAKRKKNGWKTKSKAINKMKTTPWRHEKEQELNSYPSFSTFPDPAMTTNHYSSSE